MNIFSKFRSNNLQSHPLFYASSFVLVLAFINIIILPWPNMGKISVPLRLSFGILSLICLYLDPNFRQACLNKLMPSIPKKNLPQTLSSTEKLSLFIGSFKTRKPWLQPLVWFLLFLILNLISLILNNFPAQGFRQLSLVACIYLGYVAYSYYYPKIYTYPWLAAALISVLLSSFWLLFGQDALNPQDALTAINNLNPQATLNIIDSQTAQIAWSGARFTGYPKQHPATFGWMCAMLSLICLNAYFKIKADKTKSANSNQTASNNIITASPANSTALVKSKNLSSHWFWLNLCAFMLFYLLISGSRVYIILGFGLCSLRLCLGLMPKFSWRRFCLYTAGLACIILVLGIVYLGLAQLGLIDLRADLTASNTWQSRQYIWQSAWQAFLEQPWLGHGMNSTRIYFANYLQSLPPDFTSPFLEPSTTHAHNFILHFLAEGGILGCIAISGLIATCLWQNRGTDIIWPILMILGTSILDLFMGAREHTSLSFTILAAATMLKPTTIKYTAP